MLDCQFLCAQARTARTSDWNTVANKNEIPTLFVNLSKIKPFREFLVCLRLVVGAIKWNKHLLLSTISKTSTLNNTKELLPTDVMSLINHSFVKTKLIHLQSPKWVKSDDITRNRIWANIWFVPLILVYLLQLLRIMPKWLMVLQARSTNWSLELSYILKNM